MMNTGKIMIGFSLILLSIAMMVSPSGATGPGETREVGCGIALLPGETGGPAGLHPGSCAPFITDEPRANATYPYER